MLATGKGYSLLELVVVMLIASLLGAALPLAYSRLKSAHRLDLLVEAVRHELTTDRVAAMRAGQIEDVSLDAGNLRGLRTLSTTSPLSITFEAAGKLPGPPRYFPDGTVTPGDILISTKEGARRLRLHAITGSVELL
jgi:prepilin-type N-terminal cleavage/methylation domain-containing protein